MTENVPSAVRWVGVAAARTDNLTALAAGTRIGRYEIVGVLGAGGFGITYRGYDRHLGREVAIKEYLPTSFAARQPDLMVLPRSTQVADSFRWGRERFLDEARTLARLTDARGVVDVFDFLEANGTAYMVMALVRGETLEACLKRDGRLSQRAIEQMLHPLLDGLDKVHAANFLHRDIKPANILINEDGQPTLIDFGAARVAFQGHTQAMTAIYTPGYAAFEQFTSAKQGPWTDIYGLGATLYHCINGAPPPAATDRMIGDTLVPATQLGAGRYAPGLLAGIDAAVRLKPDERPQSIGQWRQLLASDPSSMLYAPAAPATRRMDPPKRKRRGVWLAVAAALLVCLAGGGLYLWQKAEQAAQQRAAAEAARLQAEAKRQAEEVAARKLAEEKAAAEAELRRRAAEEAAARQATEERARVEADEKRRSEEAAARRRIEAVEEARRWEEEVRRAAEEKARAEAARKAAASQSVTSSAPPPSRPADFPMDRWAKGDLSLLKGCWVFGYPTPSTLTQADGRVIHGIDRALRLCYDNSGNGALEQISEYPGHSPFRCTSSLTTRFQSNGTLRSSWPSGRCEPSRYSTNAGTGVCRRVSDTQLLCSFDGVAGEHMMRREGK